jgi:hypothetical protein
VFAVMTEPPSHSKDPFAAPRSEGDEGAHWEGWAVRHRRVIAILLTLGSLLAGFEAADLLDGHVPLKRGAIGFIATGLVMIAGDLGARRYAGEGGGFARYMGGPSLRGLPVFVVGILIVVLAIVFLRN